MKATALNLEKASDILIYSSICPHISSSVDYSNKILWYWHDLLYWLHYLLVFSRGDKEASSWEGKLCMHHKAVLSVSKTPKVTAAMNLFQENKLVRKRQNAAWPFRSEPSSDQAVSTVASYSIRTLTTK